MNTRTGRSGSVSPWLEVVGVVGTAAVGVFCIVSSGFDEAVGFSARNLGCFMTGCFGVVISGWMWAFRRTRSYFDRLERRLRADRGEQTEEAETSFGTPRWLWVSSLVGAGAVAAIGGWSVYQHATGRDVLSIKFFVLACFGFFLVEAVWASSYVRARMRHVETLLTGHQPL